MAPAASLLRSKKYWEELAQMDPCWAILSDPLKKFRRWDQYEFFLTGDLEISQLMEAARQLGYPQARNLAFDFGCGVGRLTRALGKHFERCVGVDISEEMVATARKLNERNGNCDFVLNVSDALEQFSGDSFDLIYTSIVLQHVPTKSAILGYVAEFIRTLKPGGLLAMQVPSFIPWLGAIQPRRRLYGFLRYLGVPSLFIYERLGLTPIAMNSVSEKEMVQFLSNRGAITLKVQRDSMAGRSIESRTYFVTKSSK